MAGKECGPRQKSKSAQSKFRQNSPVRSESDNPEQSRSPGGEHGPAYHRFFLTRRDHPPGRPSHRTLSGRMRHHRAAGRSRPARRWPGAGRRARSGRSLLFVDRLAGLLRPRPAAGGRMDRRPAVVDARLGRALCHLGRCDQRPGPAGTGGPAPGQGVPNRGCGQGAGRALVPVGGRGAARRWPPGCGRPGAGG